jgi:hypothetical protein
MYRIIIIITLILILLFLLFNNYNYIKNTMENNKNTIDTNNIKNLQNLGNIKTIPLNLYQTWKTLDLPPKMKENVELLKKQNPEFTHYLYDDKMCRDFIEEHFDKSILYTFDKLNPGAYKADLFRYCVLYINGGIYLDIKYRCVKNFKLIYLTNTEYYVRDLSHNNGIHGIYQALLICYPYNNILLKCINDIVNIVKNNYRGLDINMGGSLSITGPLLMSKHFYQNEIISFELNLDASGTYINFKHYHILEIYKEYRKEQSMLSNGLYYSVLYEQLKIYNYINLETLKTIDLTRTIIKTINNKDITFYSSSPCIINHPTNRNTYIINIRWINYKLNEKIQNVISLNSRFEVNKNFEKISKEMFIDDIYNNKIPNDGIEDIRLFNNANNIVYIGSVYDTNRKIISISYNNYNYNLNEFQLTKNIIIPSFYNISIINRIEKNWSLFNYNGEMSLVYSWYPLKIGKINNNLLNITNIKYNVPEHFKDAKGSTPGFIKNNEIWFVLHKSQRNKKDETEYINYQHFFAIFDLDMNLLRYSELFKLNNSSVEFCIGLIIEIDRIILSYSILDIKTKISTYSIDYINNKLVWYKNIPEINLLKK